MFQPGGESDGPTQCTVFDIFILHLMCFFTFLGSGKFVHLVVPWFAPPEKNALDKEPAGLDDEEVAI